MLKQVYGAGSPATFKGGIGPAYRVVNTAYTTKSEHKHILQTSCKCNAYAMHTHKRIPTLMLLLAGPYLPLDCRTFVTVITVSPVSTDCSVRRLVRTPANDWKIVNDLGGIFLSRHHPIEATCCKWP